jgi:NAD(P)-dependent dehydrogenase (short-subunit alcohol dehydrogenase family)
MTLNAMPDERQLALAPLDEKVDHVRGSPADGLILEYGDYECPYSLQLMIDVNLAPALWLSQAVVPHMRQQGSGAIVHVAARPGLEPSGGMAAYSVSKAALVHLTRILDIELRPHGIRVNAVAPQLLDTPANRATFPAEVMTHTVAPEAIAGVIASLISDATAPLSGAILPAYGA